jgi:hypothetical protein
MEWQAEIAIRAPIQRVEALLFDPEAIARTPKYLSGIERADLLSLSEHDGIVERVVHFVPSLAIPWFAKRVRRDAAEWTEYLRWDRVSHEGTFTIEPNMPPEWRPYFDAGGRYRLRAREDGTTLRTVEANLSIRAGIMSGAIPERIVVGILKRQFRREAAMYEHDV